MYFFSVCKLCSFAPLAPKAPCGWVEDGDAEVVYSRPVLLDFCVMALPSLPEFAHLHSYPRPIGSQVRTCPQRFWLKRIVGNSISKLSL